MITYLLIFGVFMLASWLISHLLKSKFLKFSLLPMNNVLSGRDIAGKFFRGNGIIDVKIISITDERTDHYNPVSKTINLNRDVYFGNHIAAGAVSAHKCGYTVQHAQTHSWLRMRSNLVPFVSFAFIYKCFLVNSCDWSCDFSGLNDRNTFGYKIGLCKKKNRDYWKTNFNWNRIENSS